jgi:hypothetical protein
MGSKVENPSAGAVELRPYPVDSQESQTSDYLAVILETLQTM